MYALISLLIEQEKEENWRTYTAQSLWMLVRIAHAPLKAECKYPSYLDVIDEKKTDERSGREIIEDLIKKMEGGGGDGA